MMDIHGFNTWLEATPVSQFIQNVTWVIPTVQSVHILAIAAVMSSVLLLDLRLVGLVGRYEGVARFTHRYLPWVWWSLLVLFLTGATLVIGEPGRSLANPTFLLKMTLLACVAILTLVIQRPMLRDELYWESKGRRVRVRVLAAASLALWLAIVCCGRWIAYTS